MWNAMANLTIPSAPINSNTFNEESAAIKGGQCASAPTTFSPQLQRSLADVRAQPPVHRGEHTRRKMAESRYLRVAAGPGFQKSVIRGWEKLDRQLRRVRHRIRQVGCRFNRRRFIQTTEQSEHRLVHPRNEWSRIEAEIVLPHPLQSSSDAGV
jgi:hypothetical protein